MDAVIRHTPNTLEVTVTFHTISKLRTKFQSRKKILSVVLKLMRALMISAVRWKAVQPDLSCLFPCVGVPTLLAVFAVLISLKSCRVGNITAPFQTANGCALKRHQTGSRKHNEDGEIAEVRVDCLKRQSKSSSLFSQPDLCPFCLVSSLQTL